MAIFIYVHILLLISWLISPRKSWQSFLKCNFSITCIFILSLGDNELMVQYYPEYLFSGAMLICQTDNEEPFCDISTEI